MPHSLATLCISRIVRRIGNPDVNRVPPPPLPPMSRSSAPSKPADATAPQAYQRSRGIAAAGRKTPPEKVRRNSGINPQFARERRRSGWNIAVWTSALRFVRELRNSQAKAQLRTTRRPSERQRASAQCARNSRLRTIMSETVRKQPKPSEAAESRLDSRRVIVYVQRAEREKHKSPTAFAEGLQWKVFLKRLTL